MTYNLTKLFNSLPEKNAGFIIFDYANSGIDGITAMGYKNKVSLDEVCARLEALADPAYINLRRTWGVKNSTTPYKVSHLGINYYCGYYNAYALDAPRASIGILKFPLTNTYMALLNNLEYFKYDNYENDIKFLEEKLHIKVKEVSNKYSTIKIKRVPICKIINKYYDQKHPLKAVKNFIFPSLKHKKEEIDKIKVAELKYGRSRAYISNNYMGQKISDGEKLLMLLDAYSKKVNIKLAKRYKRRMGLKVNADRDTIVFISELLTDINLALIFDMDGNNRQIDNALRLQLSNAIHTLNCSENLVIASKCAHIATYAILKQLGKEDCINKIISTRKKMGITYKQEPKNVYDVIYGATQNNIYEIVGDEIFYLESADVFDIISNSIKANELEK